MRRRPRKLQLAALRALGVGSSRPAAQRRGVLIPALTLILVSLMAGSASAAASDFTWSGAAPVGTPTSSNWSNATNWGGSAPSGTVGTLTFPALTSAACTAMPPTTTCNQTNNDITALSVNAVSIDDGTSYDLGGRAFTLGAGGLTASTSSISGFIQDTVFTPITLGASQSWSIDGHGSVPNNHGQVGLYAPVTGASASLGVALSSRGNLVIAGASAGGTGDMEVGPVTITGANTSDSGTMAPSNGIVDLFATTKLNATTGNPVNLTHVALFTGATPNASGPLTVTGGFLHVGDFLSTPAGALAVNGGVTLDAATAVTLVITHSGTTAGTDYSQLSATGAVNLAGAQLTVEGGTGGVGSACPTLNPGDVDTLITTPGSLAGTFSGVPEGATVQVNCSPGTGTGTPPQVKINYTAHGVTATVLVPGAQHTLSVALAGTGSGTVTGGGINCPTTCSASYATGTMVTLTAIPAVGSTFTGWSGGCSGVVPCTVTMASDQAVTATFIASGQAVPTIISAPTISGAATQGQTLTETNGTWTNGPTSFAYQWQDCDTAGTNCTAIASATGQTYTLTTSDVGHTIRVQETASNAGGASSPASSAATAVVAAPAPPPPSNTLPPTITGTTTQGQTLTEHNGSWTDSPTSFAYQWQDCDVAGNSCAAIAGATGQTYVLAASDVGHAIRVQESATNAGGTGGPVASAATAVVQAPTVTPVAPASTGAPSIVGSPAVGVTLGCRNGFWSGSTPQTYAFQWLRDGTVIAGATGGTYTITTADGGHALSCLVTASNSAGSASATSASVGVPVNTSQDGVASVGHARVKGTTVSVPVSCDGLTGQSCTVTLKLTVRETLKRGRVIAVSASRRTVTVGRTTVTLAAGQSKTVHVKLNHAGRTLLARRHKLSAKLRVSQAKSSGSTSIGSQKITFKTTGKTTKKQG